ncbi:MAG: arsenite efflux transporter metallochaperone ArsD [Dehalogenimonas sp.]
MKGQTVNGEGSTKKKIEIFDPAMCCSTGVCGPSIDPELMRVATTISALKEKGFVIQRYGLSTETQQFVSNTVINDLLQKEGAQVLPVTLVDGEVVRTKTYPTSEEFAAWSGVSVNVEPPSKKRCCDGGPAGCCSDG